MKNQLFYLLTISFFFVSCSSSKDTVLQNNISSHHKDQTAVLWQQTSAEYEALCYQSFNIAKYRILQQHQSGDITNKKNIPAVVMDIDETVLDNSAYYAKLIIENKEYSEKSWNEWVETASAQAIPGAQDFIQFLIQNGIEVIFITNRSQQQREATFQNLSKFGIEVKPENFYFRDDTPDKAERKSQITPDFDVLLYIGDNLRDLSELFDQLELNVSQRKQMLQSEIKNEFGNNLILLPNSIYGDWKKALKLNDNQSKSTDMYDDERMYLKSY